MLSFLAANLSTIVVGAIVFGLTALSVRAAIRDLRSGRCAGCKGCPGGCSGGCSGSCHGHSAGR